MLARLLESNGYVPAGPGAAVVVGETGRLPERAASGVARAGVDFTTDTVSYVASLSKQFVGVCTAMLVLGGELDLESTLRRWLPELPDWADGVRVRHLLHHTGGLPADRELSERSDRSGEARWDSQTVFEALRKSPRLRFSPGSRYEYCNAGYISLVAILEHCSGTSFPALAQRLLFQPFGMHRTEFCDSAAAIPAAAAVGYPALGETGTWPLPLSIGNGGLWSTAEDLALWNDALLPGGRLDQRVRDMIGTPGELDDGTPIDYAWGVRVFRENGVLVHSHGGSWPGGWTAKSIRLPELGVAIAAVSNDGDVPRMVRLTDAIRKLHTSSSPA